MNDTVDRVAQAQAHLRAAIMNLCDAYAQAIMADRKPNDYKFAGMVDDMRAWLTELGMPAATPAQTSQVVD